MEAVSKNNQSIKWNAVCDAGVHTRVGQLCLTAPAENWCGHGAVLIWDQTENPFPQEFNQGQTSD